MIKRPWTEADDAAIRARYPEERTTLVAKALGRSVASVYQRAYALGLLKSPAYLNSPAACRTTGTQGMGTRFRKGNVPANKGLRGRKGWAPGRMAETQFKRGVRQGVALKNWQPVGAVRVDGEGYLRIKVREARPGEAYGFGNVGVWPLMQRHVWAQAHGPIPEGYVVAFKDRNKTHCALDNLELVSRRDLMKRNSVHNLPAPLPQVIQLLGAIRRQIRKRA